LMSISFVYPNFLWLSVLVPLTVALALLGPRRPTPVRFWSSLALRIFFLTAIILALCGIQLRLRADTLTAVFLLDVSDSIPEEQQSYGESLIRSAIAEMPPGDKAAVVVFGQDALVERLASEENSLPGLASVPVTFRTDIASALQLGLALFPAEGAKRLVLLSDGRENLGEALEQAELAAAHEIELSFIPLQGPQGEIEVLVEALNTPSDVRAGQSIDLTAILQSTAQSSGTLRVFGDGELIYTQDVRLQPGTNRFLIPVEAGESGFRRFQAQILPNADTRLQNNAASAFTVVHGPPHVLLVEGQPADGNNLAEALDAAGMQVSRVSPESMPATLAELATYDAVVLANVPAGSLPDGVMETLPVYVRELGRGLLMAGGENSFGAGGYLRSSIEEALPVYMDVRARELSANLALVLAVDKSGSMGRCHCDNPDLNQTYTRQEVGQPKVDIAKEAIMRAASALSDQDILGVVAFDDQARWAVEASRLTDLVTLEQSIGGIQAFGQTNVGAGVEAAYEALQNSDARRKHIILLTDGWTHSGDLTGLAEEMSTQGITLSVVAAGEGSAEYLEDLADAGGGRYYPAKDIFGVPDFFLKETITAVGEYIIEQPFYPLPSLPGQALSGLDPAGLPALYGYNGTSPKNTAQTQLATPQGHPLLVTWQYGLGRSAAWTSDLKNQWAADWVGWEGFPRFAAQLVGWTLPAPQEQGLVSQAGLEQDRAIIRLEAEDEDGRPRNFLEALATVIDPDLQSQEVRLSQVGAGRYESSMEVSEPGTYLIRLGVNEGGQSLGQQTLGIVVPYSPEYKESGTQLGFLEALAGVTGGGLLADPVAAFTHDLPIADYAREIWRPLLFAVALLFPLDVALRRVILSPGDLRKAGDWLRERLPTARLPAPSEGRALGPLFQARERAQQRTRQRRSESAPKISRAPRADKSKMPETPEIPNVSDQPPSSTEDTLARLRDAKRRARREK
jgi:Mg-chelatase subunit ChlD/uncharacterized membrane protein